MKITGIPILLEFAGRHTDVEPHILAWIEEVKVAEWHSSQDVLLRYPAKIIDARNVVFRFKGNRYRLHVKINYAAQVVFVVRMGTHKDYDSWTY